MDNAEKAMRIQSLAGRAAGYAMVSLTPAGPASRLSLRVPEQSVNAISKALGVALPGRKRATQKGSRAVLSLGPDEWLVIDEAGDDLMQAFGKVKQFHSAVDVSHRNVGIVVAGAGAEATISAGCPQDISLAVFPVGACSRTILGKIEIVLWRTAEDTFRVECWRSFSDYAFAFLGEAARDAVA